MSKVPQSDSEKETLLVAGSAGFVGKALLRRLAEKHRPVVSLYNAHLPEAMAYTTPIFADILRPEFLPSALHNTKTVVHLAWSQSFHSRWEEALWGHEGTKQDSRNIQMVKNLVQAMEEAGTQRIIFLSALGARRDAESWYLQEKYFAEAVILNSRIPEKIILRSSLVFSDLSAKDRFVSTIERLMRFPWFYPVPRCREKLAPIHVFDLCETITKLIDLEMRESAYLLEIDGGEALALEDMFRYISQGIGKGTHIALRGLLGQTLAPLIESLNRRSQKDLPQLRDLLTIGHQRAPEAALNNPMFNALPRQTRRFKESMTAGAPEVPPH